jgi:cellulose synthase (UDP-forming)
MDPAVLNKYLYIERTPTWLVRTVSFFGIFAWILVLYGYSGAVLFDPFFRYVIGPLLFFLSLYFFLNHGLLLFYKRPDLKKHLEHIKKYWETTTKEPGVDVFLPICDETMQILEHTWENVAKLKYRNVKVYVLDDSKIETDLHRELARAYGFIYLARPNRGEVKKAGNLKYGYEHSSSEFVVIFDADFAPHPDFIHDLLPYMGDPKVAVVQSPQYFETREPGVELTAWEYTGARGQEMFYRFFQTTRDRFNAAVCCGSNAIYRRSAIDDIGGTVQVEYGEDTRTGMKLTSSGWYVRYVDVILAVGLSPDNAHSFFHQQHRWCMSSMEQVLGKTFWTSPLTWQQKASYLSGYLFYLHQPIQVLFTFQLFWTLFVYNPYITLGGAIIFYPYLFFSFVLMQIVVIQKFKWKSFYGFMLLTYSCAHAVLTALFKQTGTWIPTGSKVAGVSGIFKQVTLMLAAYLFFYISFVGLAFRFGLFHIHNPGFYTLEFWIAWNIIFSGTLLWQLYKTIERAHAEHLLNSSSSSSIRMWQLKTAGVYIVLAVGMFLFLVYS